MPMEHLELIQCGRRYSFAPVTGARTPLRTYSFMPNIIGNVSGHYNTIIQIDGSAGVKPKAIKHPSIANLDPFTIDWFMYFQASTPLIGREYELEILTKFLESDDDFRWWTILGEGGSGKSRLCFELIERLPSGWKGGFLAKETITATAFANWEATENTLWIVDYAAAVQSQVRDIIAILATRSRPNAVKIRVLLLERGYSESGGWWDELIETPDSKSILIRYTMHSPPFPLSNLSGNQRSFLVTIGSLLEPDRGIRLLSQLEKLSDNQISTQTANGNPLLLQLLAAELTDPNATLGQGNTRGNLVDRFLLRELSNVERACHLSGLNFHSMLKILFLTTSAFPISLVLEKDIVFVHNREQGVLLLRRPDGLLEAPSRDYLRRMGVDVDERNAAVLRLISDITKIDDPGAYLAALNEATSLGTRRFAIQPDLFGDAFIALMLNTPGTHRALATKRGEFSRDAFADMAFNIFTSFGENSASNWARLDGIRIRTLLDHLRFAGRSIRAVLLVIRAINLRSAKIASFDPRSVFAANSVHPEAKAVGRVYGFALDSIRANGDKWFADRKITSSKHAWVLPFIDSLHELSTRERGRLAVLIANISHREVIDRDTNHINFVRMIQRTLRGISATSHDLLSNSDKKILGAAARNFCRFAKIHTPLRMIQDFDELAFRCDLVNVFNMCAFGVMHQRFGVEETPETRAEAFGWLKFAHVVLPDASLTTEREFWKRNEMWLAALDLDDQAASNMFLAGIAEMEAYASSDQLTGALCDFLQAAARRRSPNMLVHVYDAMLAAKSNLIVGDKIADSLQSLTHEWPQWKASFKQTWERCVETLGFLLCIFRSVSFASADVAVKDVFEVVLESVKIDESQRDLAAEYLARERREFELGNSSPKFLDTVLDLELMAGVRFDDLDSFLPSGQLGKSSIVDYLLDFAPFKGELSEEALILLASNKVELHERWIEYVSPHNTIYRRSMRHLFVPMAVVSHRAVMEEIAVAFLTSKAALKVIG
jgi:hypothetical protein